MFYTRLPTVYLVNPFPHDRTTSLPLFLFLSLTRSSDITKLGPASYSLHHPLSYFFFYLFYSFFLHVLLFLRIFFSWPADSMGSNWRGDQPAERGGARRGHRPGGGGSGPARGRTGHGRWSRARRHSQPELGRTGRRSRPRRGAAGRRRARGPRCVAEVTGAGSSAGGGMHRRSRMRPGVPRRELGEEQGHSRPGGSSGRLRWSCRGGARPAGGRGRGGARRARMRRSLKEAAAAREQLGAGARGGAERRSSGGLARTRRSRSEQVGGAGRGRGVSVQSR